jgi:hypothetical protein
MKEIILMKKIIAAMIIICGTNSFLYSMDETPQEREKIFEEFAKKCNFYGCFLVKTEQDDLKKPFVERGVIENNSWGDLLQDYCKDYNDLKGQRLPKIYNKDTNKVGK